MKWYLVFTAKNSCTSPVLITDAEKCAMISMLN
jgi:hypothetical protein